MADIRQEAPAEREAAALHLWDEGLVRPESLAFAVVDSLTDAGYIAGASRPASPASAKQVSREAVEAVAAALATYDLYGRMEADADVWAEETAPEDQARYVERARALIAITARSGAES